MEKAKGATAVDQPRLVRFRLSVDDTNADGKPCELQVTAYPETLGLVRGIGSCERGAVQEFPEVR